MSYKRGPDRLPKTKKALAEVVSGKTIVQAAKDNGITYGYLYNIARKEGIKGGWRQRDLRPLIERARSAIQINEDTGHWFWIGPDPSTITKKGPRTKRNWGRFLAGKPLSKNPFAQRSMCGITECINPEHSQKEKFPARNAEIIALWNASEEAKKVVFTLEEIGKKYGLTRERVRQIIEGIDTDGHP